MKFVGCVLFAFSWVISPSAFGQEIPATPDVPELSLSQQIQALDLSASADGVDSAVVVQDANTGEVVYARNADALLNPASNAKVLTTLAALSFLTPEFRFKTQLVGGLKEKGDGKKSDSKKKAKENKKNQDIGKILKDGHLEVLALKGFGDPSFTSYRLEAMVRSLKTKGIKSVGEVRIDETYFDGRYIPGHDGGFSQRSFDIGSLFLDDNQMQVVVTPAAAVGEKATVNLDPPLGRDLICEGEVLTQVRGSKVSVRQSGDPLNGLGIAVDGSISVNSAPQSYRMSCKEPGSLAGHRLVDLLQRTGIRCPEEFRLAAAPFQGAVLAEEKSTELEELLRIINKKSDNFLAELLAKVLGAEYGGQPGSTEKGMKAVLRELNATGVDVNGIYMENGSGLSRNTRVKAKTLVTALQKVYDNPRLRENFIESLSVLGVDGTLRRRFRNTELAGKFVGKTGTLRGVSALSGFAFPRSGIGEKTYIYSHLINGYGKGFWQQRQLMNQILEILLNQ